MVHLNHWPWDHHKSSTKKRGKRRERWSNYFADAVGGPLVALAFLQIRLDLRQPGVPSRRRAPPDLAETTSGARRQHQPMPRCASHRARRPPPDSIAGGRHRHSGGGRRGDDQRRQARHLPLSPLHLTARDLLLPGRWPLNRPIIIHQNWAFKRVAGRRDREIYRLGVISPPPKCGKNALF